MLKRTLILAAALLLVSGILWAGSTSWTGVVSDSMCGLKHSKASAKAAECVEKCVREGAKYTLVSGGKLYQVEPQEKFKDLGGKHVKVTGALSGDTITVDAVEPAGGTPGY